jgi:hypothetical protein
MFQNQGHQRYQAFAGVRHRNHRDEDLEDKTDERYERSGSISMHSYQHESSSDLDPHGHHPDSWIPLITPVEDESFTTMSNETSKQHHCKIPSSLRWRHKLLIVVTTLSMIVASYGSWSYFRSANRKQTEQHHHKETIPTILSVVHDQTREYIYALDNPLYDRLKNATFHAHDDGSVEVSPTLTLDKTTILSPSASLTLTWTVGRNVWGDPVVDDESVIILQCGDDLLYVQESLTHHLDESTLPRIIEAATIAQATATHQKHNAMMRTGNPDSVNPFRRQADQTDANTWRFPSFPILRYRVCQFSLYDVHWNPAGYESWHLVAKSKGLDVSASVTTPTNVHLALGDDPSTMIVNFVTGGGSHGTAAIGTPIVVYGTDEAHMMTKVTGTSDSYTADDLCQAPANQTEPGKFQSPGQLHTAILTDLVQNTTYHYKVGYQHGQGITWSDVYRFISAPAVGISEQQQPFAYIVYGDQGCPSAGWGVGSLWTAAMTTREVHNATIPIRAVHHFGDLSYAQGAAHQWDQWFTLIEPFATQVPLMVAVGNHEYDHDGGGKGKDPSGVNTEDGFHPAWGNFGVDSGGECGVPTSKRFRMPQNSPSSNGVFWYSYDYASVHTTVISSEHDMSEGSTQFAWLQADLASVNRSLTPWLIVESHRPMYEGEAIWEQNAVGIAMRYEIEDLLQEFQVDLFLAGHYHAYHRTCDGLYKSECEAGGPIHITVGTAGAALSDSTLYDNEWTEVFIKQDYGYGRITVANSTALLFQFVKAGDESDTTSGVVRDSVWIFRDR